MRFSFLALRGYLNITISYIFSLRTFPCPMWTHACILDVHHLSIALHKSEKHIDIVNFTTCCENYKEQSEVIFLIMNEIHIQTIK